MTGARTVEDLAAGEAYGANWFGLAFGWFDPEPGLRVTVCMELTGEWKVWCRQVNKYRFWAAPTLAAAVAKAALADWGRA